MNLHKHARLTPHGRALLVRRVQQGLRIEEAAQAAGVSVRTAYKWLRRFREEGEAGLQDRSSRPRHCPHATSSILMVSVIELRRERRTYRQIASELGLAVSTVARRLKRVGLHRLAELDEPLGLRQRRGDHDDGDHRTQLAGRVVVLARGHNNGAGYRALCRLISDAHARTTGKAGGAVPVAVTRAELALLARHGSEIAARFGPQAMRNEYGAGGIDNWENLTISGCIITKNLGQFGGGQAAVLLQRSQDFHGRGIESMVFHLKGKNRKDLPKR